MQTGTGQTGMQTFNKDWPTLISQNSLLGHGFVPSSNPDELQDMINRGVSSPAGGENASGIETVGFGRRKLGKLLGRVIERSEMPVYTYREPIAAGAPSAAKLRRPARRSCRTFCGPADYRHENV